MHVVECMPAIIAELLHPAWAEGSHASFTPATHAAVLRKVVGEGGMVVMMGVGEAVLVAVGG